MKFIDEAYKRLWADVEEKSQFPAITPLLSHYTSISTLENILKNNEFWFSNPITMNDYEELVFGMNEGAQYFRSSKVIREACIDENKYAELIFHFNSLFNAYDEHHASDTYVLCFSKHNEDNNDGVLSMWRGYGHAGGGVAIVIDTSQITPLQESPIRVAPVVYASKEKRIGWIENNLSQLADCLSRENQDSKILRNYAYIWLKRLISFSLFTKHEGFHEEEEWRMVYMRDRDETKSLESMFSYHVNEHGLQPKLKLKLDEIPGSVGECVDLETIIEKIILGPTSSNILTYKALERMIDLLGRPKLKDKIVYSTIPFRHGR